MKYGFLFSAYRERVAYRAPNRVVSLIVNEVGYLGADCRVTVHFFESGAIESFSYGRMWPPLRNFRPDRWRVESVPLEAVLMGGIQK